VPSKFVAVFPFASSAFNDALNGTPARVFDGAVIHDKESGTTACALADGRNPKRQAKVQKNRKKRSVDALPHDINIVRRGSLRGATCTRNTLSLAVLIE
jgi:hypothetical protein